MQKKEVAETPLMKQYNQIKTKYPGAILLFRVGDFYETFGEDAIKAAQILGIVLTKRANGSASHIELAGFPHHSLDTYLPKLVRAGQRVAICDQLEDPKMTKTIVKRGVTELITPGVSYNDKILDHKVSNYLAAIYFDKEVTGVSFLDISTGEFMAAQGDLDYIDKLIQGFKPAEIIIAKNQFKGFQKQFGDRFYTYQLDDWAFQYDFAHDKLIGHFNTANLKGFGIEQMPAAIVAAGVCLHYLTETHHNQVQHIQSLSRIDEQQYVWLDRFTIRNLELLYPANENGVSLLQVLDKTVTPMGARLLKKWLVLPLKDCIAINERLAIVDYAHKQTNQRHAVLDHLKSIGDLERLISKVAMGRVNPREMQQLNRSLKQITPVKAIFLQSKQDKLVGIANQLHDCSWVIEKIDTVLKTDPPIAANKGEVINEGVDAELDELRKIAYSGKDYLLQLQQKEQQRTGITSLKISYNNVFGYYLEVTNAHKDKVPAEWIRKQTLTNAERYITEELKEYEEKILGAEGKIAAIEERLYTELITAVSEYVGQIQQNALVLARIDCLFAFAVLAEKYHYTKPVLNDGKKLILKDARHPVIEQQLKIGEPYISNDIYLDNEQQQVIILTGPNMSGKSALLRQTALNVIMAQIGSFVPSAYAEIGLVDKIFTRVGASDNISSGESTFMVEMTETASILNNISDRSLILLDEIGRGTSTYDGVSIAWAIADFICNHPAKPKTLFATHYHELNDLEKTHSSIRNFHIEIKEANQKIIFLRKLKEGGSEHSFGIHVAKMAGMPQIVVRKAQQMLTQLESQREDLGEGKPKGLPQVGNMQLSMFQLNDPVLEQLRDELQILDVNTLSPIEALMKLNELKKMMKK
ncbi:DNA mismatch repair protein MutS [Bacteroidetes bacterium UKL13-3]|jgi:DNA mismatch repair protein MutS|nr:DNA mismatch repair protein MutS [Bacteroidetes bacterium UKL13-3]HCP92460.1 DNA mismatch repair protein MutS [Bacteroidota bacterium]